MIQYCRGFSPRVDVQAFVQPVNCEGIIGSPLNNEVRAIWPFAHHQWQSACRLGAVHPGQIFVVATNSLKPPVYILDLPVRLGCDDEFSYDYVRSGLEDLVRVLDSFCIQSLAIAPLLSSRDIADDGEVLTMLGTALGPLKDKKIYVYVR